MSDIDFQDAYFGLFSGATPEQLNGAIAYLLDHGLVQVEEGEELVQLSDQALRKLIR